MDAPELLSEHRCFGGTVGFYRHASAANELPDALLGLYAAGRRPMGRCRC